MSFKRLTDGQRRRALPHLLTAANSLEGLSLSIAFNKRSESVFEARPPLDLSNPQFAAFRKWKTDVLEKAFFICHVLGVLLAGLAVPGQNVLWFTDEDSIAANDDRVRELTQLFAWISSLYLTFTLGHCGCGTSRCDNGSRQIEDLLAIPDMIAGAIAEQLALKVTDPSELADVFWMHRGDFSDKTKSITWWFSDSGSLTKSAPRSGGSQPSLGLYFGGHGPPRLAEDVIVRKKHQTKLVHEGEYVAEVDIEFIYTDEGWSPYLSLDDAQKLDHVREELRRGDLKAASQHARVYSLTPIAL